MNDFLVFLQILLVLFIERPNGRCRRPYFVAFGDASVSDCAVVDVIDLVVEAEYARDRHEGNCPERSRSGQLELQLSGAQSLRTIGIASPSKRVA